MTDFSFPAYFSRIKKRLPAKRHMTPGSRKFKLRDGKFITKRKTIK